jgi:outer membrane receptor protein involved in Fe transport
MLSYILIFVSSFFILQQNEGNIGGKIIDSRNLQPLPGATVFVESLNRGVAADKEGNFLLRNIPAGSYNLSFRFIGYTPVNRANVVVAPNRTTTLEIRMNIDLIEGDEVEVRGTYFERPRDAIISANSMDFEEIRRSPGDLVDIQRVVQVLPSVASGSDQLNEIIVRGGNPGENLFLMDHIEIPNPNHFAVQGAGGGPINLLNSYMVREIDFYAGAFPARYGDKASSVMNISLRNGSFDRFQGEGSLGMAGAGALLEGPFSSKGSFIFSARRSYLDWIIAATGLTAVPNYYNTQGKLTYNLSQKHTLLLNGVFGSDNINIEGGDEAGYGRGAENLDTQNSQIITGATLRSVWSDKLFSFTTASLVQNNYYVEVYDTPGREVFFVNDSQEREITFKTDFTYLVNQNFEVSFGGNQKFVNMYYDITNDADTLYTYSNGDPDLITGIYAIYPEYRVAFDETSFKSALYSQVTYEFPAIIRITGGLRYDYFDYNSFSSLSPRLGLSIPARRNTTLNAAYGKHYQSPSYNELAANDANRLLRNKYTDQFVIGIEHHIRDDIKFTLEGFHKDYSDVPIRKTLTTAEPLVFDDGTYLNAGKATSKGVELFLQKKLVNRFSGIASYSYSESIAEDPRSGNSYNWDFDYRHMLIFISGYRFNFDQKDWYQSMKSNWWFSMLSWIPFMPADEIEISLKFRYLGGRPYTAPLYRPDLRRWIVDESLSLNTERYPAYHRLDLRIDKRFSYPNMNYVIFFDIVNLYNRDNVWSFQYNDDGTMDTVLQFNTLPVAGISIEF